MNWMLFVIMMFPMLSFIASAYIWKAFFDRDDRRSPINTKLHSTPGEGLRRRIDKIDDDMTGVLIWLFGAGPLLAGVWLTMRLRDVDMSKMQYGFGDFVFLAIILSSGFVAFWHLLKLGKKRRAAKQGLHGEIAVSQYLSPLMAKGCLIFNDVPADGFNLDHVVIGPSAVFAVETKSRKKPKETSRQSVTVTYDGACLKFPSHVETKPLTQAKAQARWLSEMLAGAAGEAVPVVPVIALPGWWVENTQRGASPEVWVTTGKNANFMVSSRFGPALSDSLRNRIAYALSQRYPDVE